MPTSLLIVLLAACADPASKGSAGPIVIPYNETDDNTLFDRASNGSAIPLKEARAILASHLIEKHGAEKGTLATKWFDNVQCIIDDEYAFSHSGAWQVKRGICLVGYRVDRHTGSIRRVEMLDAEYAGGLRYFPSGLVPVHNKTNSCQSSSSNTLL
jgi:hypothetical protein